MKNPTEMMGFVSNLNGPLGPFFHRFFALKREEIKCATWVREENCCAT
jgi:hypothetical protein